MSEIESKILEFIAADEYAAANPEINESNVFSVSTLAWDWKRQVEYKCKAGNHARAEVNYDMFRGKAIHEYLQRRFEREGWIAEFKLSKYLDDVKVGDKRVMIIGHVDLYHPDTGVIVELKSSQWSDKISESYVIQAGTYAYILHEMGLRVTNVHVIKINSKLTRYTLSDSDVTRAYHEIVTRAALAADNITKCLNSPKLDDYANE